jgi:hypothetical protein
LWADLLLKARVAPVSQMQLSTTEAYDPAEVHLARANAEVTLRPFTFLTLSLAPEFAQGPQLERLTGRMQLTLPGTWTVSYALQSAALDAAPAIQNALMNDIHGFQDINSADGSMMTSYILNHALGRSARTAEAVSERKSRCTPIDIPQYGEHRSVSPAHGA